jgi:hypothetical protein
VVISLHDAIVTRGIRHWNSKCSSCWRSFLWDDHRASIWDSSAFKRGALKMRYVDRYNLL